MNRGFPKRDCDSVDGVGSTGVDVGEPTAGFETSGLPERKPARDPISAAALKFERKRDATQALQDHEAAKLERIAKTARLRAERLARDAKSASAAKQPVAPKKAK